MPDVDGAYAATNAVLSRSANPYEYLVALTVNSVFMDKSNSPFYPLLSYAIDKFADNWTFNGNPWKVERYFERLPIITANPDEPSWTKVLRRALATDLPEIVTLFSGTNEYLGNELKSLVNDLGFGGSV